MSEARRKVDFLITGGRVIDPYRNFDGIADIAVANGKIVSAENVEAKNIVDATGCLVTPGLIDYHCHPGAFSTDYGFAAESTCFSGGVTTVVDAGSYGSSTYEGFRWFSLNSKLRYKAYLYVRAVGQPSDYLPDNVEPYGTNEAKSLRMLEQYPDQLLGLKIRMGAESLDGNSLKALEAALALAEKAQCPLVVHVANSPVPVEQIARMLRPGDVFTHIYQGKGNTYIKTEEQVEEIKRHQQRGVIMDSANGATQFSFEVAELCLRNGLYPDVISTDLTSNTVLVPKRAFSLAFVMSKYLMMGLSIMDVIKATTTTPAKILGEEKNLGSLCEGTCADIAISRLIDKKVDFEDEQGFVRKGTQLLKTEMTLRAGEAVFRQIDFF